MKSTLHFLSRLRSLLHEYEAVIESESHLTIDADIDRFFAEFDFAENIISVESLTQLIEEEKEKLRETL